MKFISLGRHCDIAFNIKKYIESDAPTHFFDWSRTDFKCVLDILNIRCIDQILNIENIRIDKESFAYNNDICLTLKNIEKKNLNLLFYRDIILENYNDEEMNDKLVQFIEKYKRRFNRLIELIESKDKICFIYRVQEIKIDFEKDIELFKKILFSINKNCIFCLVFLIEGDDDFIFVKYRSYMKINISSFIDKTNNDYSWKSEHIDWEKIFNVIKSSAF
jgi:hypothetical protein